ncbi:MAG: 2-dehydropantoate 2-reductase [Planctomycetes bacterium]|nr:2-dehydropantoate 2-reductase [Planctomycetota bacterium]
MLLVVGPGAMGTLLAASLARAGFEVKLLDRDPDRARRLSQKPLVVIDPSGAPWEASVPVLSEPPSEVEVTFLCVKTGATEAAVARLAGSGTVAVLQNGCERAAAVGALLGAPERVVGLVTSEGATRGAEGRVRHGGRGLTQVGSLTPEGAPRAVRVVELLQAAGWDARLGEVRQASWEKLLVNAAINALTGILDCPNGVLLASAEASALADEAAREVARVASAIGVSGDWEPARATAAWRDVALHTSANISSTLQDLRRSQTTEVRAINGSVARLAAEHGLRAPINDLLCRLVAARQDVATHRDPGEAE